MAAIELARLALRLACGKDAVGFGAPVRAARKCLGALGPKQAFIGEVGHPGLTFGGALRRPRRQADLAYRLRNFADFLGAAAAVLGRADPDSGISR
jgi:hypothetical protein